MKIKVWVQAARLRTLPLSVSGILVGSFAAFNAVFDKAHFWLIFAFAIATTLGLQILSNFANDYGDGVKGTDNDKRVGPKRALQSGALTKEEMKKGIIITSVLTLLVSLVLIYVSFGQDNFVYSLLFFVLGISAIAAAIKYTVGKSAYGYKGLGDLFVFIFFGLVSVLGSNFLYTMQFDTVLILPAIAIGLLSIGVLNLNNMRDIKNDITSGKHTIVVKLGAAKAKTYHMVTIIIAFTCILAYMWINSLLVAPIALVFMYVFAKHLYRVNEVTDPKNFDPELKVVALGTFVVAVVLSLQLAYNF